MNVTDDYDSVIYGRPKFNSTILGPDERPHIRKGSKNTGQDALKLSPIPKDRVQFIGSNSSPFSEQQHFHNSEECSELQASDTEAKKTKLGDETSSSFVRSNSKSVETDKENLEMGVFESHILSDRSIQPKSNNTARSHITNPFDSDIMGSLCATTYSPSLFNNSKRNVECETPEKSFRWSIGQMADLHPAVIDETESMCQTCQTPDPAEESQINNAIDKFWASQKYVLPSPYFTKDSINSGKEDSPNVIQRSRALVQESPLARPVVARSIESKRSVEVQTMFTFPPNLDLMGLLGNCFQHEEGEVAVFEANLSLSTLRRKLFLDALASHANIENENEGSAMMDIDENYDNERFNLERPTWCHSNDEIIPARRVSSVVMDPDEETEISCRLLTPDVSPIKN